MTKLEKEFCVKKIKELEIKIKEPITCMNDKVLHNRWENWLQYFKKLLKEELTNS